MKANVGQDRVQPEDGRQWAKWMSSSGSAGGAGHLIRIMEDETNLMGRTLATGRGLKHPCHYLWRGAAEAQRDVYPCCQSYMLDGEPVGRIGERPPDLRRRGDARCAGCMRGVGGRDRICAKCCTTIPHPLLVAGSLVFHGRIKGLPGGAAHLSGEAGGWLTPPKPPAPGGRRSGLVRPGRHNGGTVRREAARHRLRVARPGGP
jgi:hypothetical protein